MAKDVMVLVTNHRPPREASNTLHISILSLKLHNVLSKPEGYRELGK